jgi:hypothetical protein
LQYKESLTDANWNDIVPDLLATEEKLSATNGMGSSLQRYYRVLVAP